MLFMFFPRLAQKKISNRIALHPRVRPAGAGDAMHRYSGAVGTLGVFHSLPPPNNDCIHDVLEHVSNLYGR